MKTQIFSRNNILFVAMSLCLLAKIVWFSYDIFHVILFSSLWKNPFIFFSFWLPKFAVVIFVSSFVFFSRKQSWTIILNVVIDIWICINYLYYHANFVFVNWDSIMLISELKDFTSSLLVYFSLGMGVYPLCTCIYMCIYKHISRNIFVPSFKIGVVAMSIAICLHLCFCKINLRPNNCYSPLCGSMMDDDDVLNAKFQFCIPFYISAPLYNQLLDAESNYIYYHSILSYLPTMFVNGIMNAPLTLNEKDESFLSMHQAAPKNSVPKYNLIVILVESFESWVIKAVDEDGNYYMPYINSIIQNDNVAYFSRIKSQVRHGISADGQLIIQTGLLPLKSGSSAMKYPRNMYPNYAASFDRSILINPCHANMYNQDILSMSYGYQMQINPNDRDPLWEDDYSFARFDSISKAMPIGDKSCIFYITYSTHTPFDRIPMNTNLTFPLIYNDTEIRYLNSFHHIDSLLGEWYQKTWMNLSVKDSTVVIITGDHNVNKFKDTYCPLVIISPSIQKNIQSSALFFQMDIYPTITNLIEIQYPHWEGLGIDLLGKDTNRGILESDAYVLSDKLIRNNYFKRWSSQ